MLTNAQKATLKAAILAETDATLVQYRVNGQTTMIAEWYNRPAEPAHYVWRSTFTSAEAREAIAGGDGLGQLDNLTAGKRDALLWLFEGVTQPSNEAQRTAILGLCGTQNTLKTSITAAQKRATSRVEKLFATGIGSEVSPATLGWEGPLSADDVASVLSA